MTIRQNRNFTENLAANYVVQQDPVTGSLEVADVAVPVIAPTRSNDGTIITSLIDLSTGDVVKVPVYDWGVNCPSAGSLVSGSIIGVSPDSFGGTGKSTLPIYLISDGSSFRPYGRQRLCLGAGSIASPISVGSASVNVVPAAGHVAFSQGATPYSMPANFLQAGMIVAAYAVISRGAVALGTAPKYALKIADGVSMSGGSSATIVSVTETTVGAGRKAVLNGTSVIGTGAALMRTGLAEPAAVGSSVGADEAPILTTSVNYFNVGVVSGGTLGDYFDLVSYALWIE